MRKKTIIKEEVKVKIKLKTTSFKNLCIKGRLNDQYF